MLVEILTDDLLERILNGKIESLSQEDQQRLMSNRQEIVHRLTVLFFQEISSLEKDSICDDPQALFFGLHLAGFLELPESFKWMRQLCHVSVEAIDEYLGSDFITEELSYLLASTMSHQWAILKSEIEDSTLNEFIRSACLNSLALASAKGVVERGDIIDYFKNLFARIINGEINDVCLTNHLVTTCLDLWPGECFEEIKEVFGLNLVDESYCDIDSVYGELSKGKEYCIQKLHLQMEQNSFWKPPHFSDSSQLQLSYEDRLGLFKILNQAKKESLQTLRELSPQKPQRNAICSCGSGKKYKKCCLGKRVESDLLSQIRLEESNITHGPVDALRGIERLSEEEKLEIEEMGQLIEAEPEKFLELASAYLSKYADIAICHHHLFCAYYQLGRHREALVILRRNFSQFPDYLFVRAEYARYLLRKGEHEEAHSILGNATTLSELYPERKIFQVGEWVAFSHVMCLYHIQKGDLAKATYYLDSLEKFSLNDSLVSFLKSKIRGSSFQNAFERLANGSVIPIA